MKKNSIQKVIHYCWFGGKPLPESAKKCIQSWKRFLPDYRIIRWDENNFDVKSCIYSKEAYEKGKYAFVSDFARLKILYEEGGLYFDTDVELIKPIPSEYLEYGFLGKQDKKYIATGLGFACRKGDNTIKKMLDGYKDISFINEDGTFDETPCPMRNTKDLDADTLANNKLTILDADFMNPYNYRTGLLKTTKNTFSIHHSDASWWSESRRARRAKRHFYVKKYGKTVGSLIYYIGRAICKVRGKND